MSQPAPGSDPQFPESNEPTQIEVHSRRGGRPLVAYALLGITVLVFILQLGTQDPSLVAGGVACGNLPACWGLKINELILAGEWWRLFTPMLLHASLLHIGFNMYALYALGPEVEHHYGHFTFLALYIFTGFAGVVLSFLFNDNPSLGASSAIFGMLGAHAVFIYRNLGIFGAQGQAVLRNILNIALINLLISLSPGIDGWGHLGGLLGGVLFAGLAAPVYEVKQDNQGYYLSNQTPLNYTWLAAGLVLLVFGGLAALKLLSH
ncbi:MAG: rhomboid family intramembrane serine protease [Anaerolineales bacterium]|nr:rhomboid family intramembrane serine protease [Anaerolineales bacterium]